MRIGIVQDTTVKAMQVKLVKISAYQRYVRKFLMRLCEHLRRKIGSCYLCALCEQLLKQYAGAAADIQHLTAGEDM